MPIAAVPSYVPSDSFAEASPSLRFGMYVQLWGVDERSKDVDNKRFALNAACTLTLSDKQRMQALADRQAQIAQSLRQAGRLLRVEGEAIAPFTTGLGNEHPLENGFAFLNPYGLPYLPGSSVKGVLRQAAQELASGKWGDEHGWSEMPAYPLTIGDDKIDLSMLDALFGRETGAGDRKHVRGALSFWDVIPVISGDRLAVEVMTPHQGHYYQQGKTPHESGSPNPITFLTVPPGSRLAFHVTCDRAHLRRLAPALEREGQWKELITAAFTHAFQWVGFGAKTSVGYGSMRLAGANVERTDRTPSEPVNQAMPQSLSGEEIVWQRARLKYNRNNGTLTASGPRQLEAYAHRPNGEQILAALPQPLQERLLSGQPTQAIARVRKVGNRHDLLAVVEAGRSPQ